MTKKQLVEKWNVERGKAAAEAGQLNIKLIALEQRIKRLAKFPNDKAQAVAEYRKLQIKQNQLAARVVTIDEFVKDV